MIQNRPTILKRLAQIIAGLNIIIVVGAIVLAIGISKRPVYDIIPVVSIVYSVLAVLIISRHPRHTVGWLFLIVGFFFSAGNDGYRFFGIGASL